jgi:hypothetical protein
LPHSSLMPVCNSRAQTFAWSATHWRRWRSRVSLIDPF